MRKPDAFTLQCRQEKEKATEIAHKASVRLGCDLEIKRHYSLPNAYFVQLNRKEKTMYQFSLFFVNDKILISTGIYDTDGTGLVVPDANNFFYHCKELKKEFNIVDEIIAQERSRFKEWMKGVFNKLAGESHEGNSKWYNNTWYNLTKAQVYQNIGFFHDCMRKKMSQCKACEMMCQLSN